MQKESICRTLGTFEGGICSQNLMVTLFKQLSVLNELFDDIRKFGNDRGEQGIFQSACVSEIALTAIR